MTEAGRAGRGGPLIRAAGTVLWRPGGSGPEIAVIHRIRHQDWTLPKGKREAGEHLLVTAARETAEETGIEVVLGRWLGATDYRVNGQPKRVDYWAARAAKPAAEQLPFRRNREVDGLAWLALGAARGRLSYPHDVALADLLGTGPLSTVPLIVLRHARAMRKASWQADDLGRPLHPDGEAEAKALADLLCCFGRLRVFSSAALRCRATVRPYAELAGAAVETDAALAVPGGPGEASQAFRRAAQIAAARAPALICAHRENLPDLLAGACSALGAPVPSGPPLDPAGFWVLHTAGRSLVSVERYHPGNAAGG
jgi:8-oxo-dGTP pyrophosphatase MutT (NUDIX family)